MESLPEERNTLLRAIWKAKGKMSYTSSSSAHKQKKYGIVAALNFLITLWGLWTRRNRQCHGQISERDKRVEILAIQLLVDYHKANERGLSTSNEASLRWAKPRGDYIKINCDASWIKESGKAGLGFVAVNESGDVLLSGARVECFASSPLEAEAKAILWATNHSNDKCYLKLCSWSFVKREGNKAAYSIATWALGCSGEIILESRVPECSCVPGRASGMSTCPLSHCSGVPDRASGISTCPLSHCSGVLGRAHAVMSSSDSAAPPIPQDEDERKPMFIQLPDPDYVLEPIHPEYIPLEDEHMFPAEEQPLPPIVSPTADSPGYVAKSDPEEDP
ncbi:reverse transcriptase [Tanacetum coccineum]